MELPMDLRGRLAELTTKRNEYTFRGNVLADKVLVSFMAPTAVGKSTLVNECLRQCAERGIDAGEAGTTTTRERRTNGDPANYVTATEGVTFASMIAQIEQGELVNWSQHGTGQLYGTMPENLSHRYTFLPTMPDSIPMMQRAGFAKVIPVYLVASVDQWTMQLDDRQNDPGRMAEAVVSLAYAKAHDDSLIILNNSRGEGDLQRRAAAIIDYMTDAGPLTSDPDTLALTDAMLAFAQKAIDGNA